MNHTVESFLTSEEETQIVEAIRKAEKQTSGEIRVHLENFEGEDTFARTREVFHLLKMDTTKARNGVLIYVAINLKKFVIYGDQGIHEKVGDAFWQSTRDLILTSFKKSNFTKGIQNGVLEIGKVLEEYFPWDSHDINELPDEISKGK